MLGIKRISAWMALFIVAAAVPAGCAWVKLEEQAAAIRVAGESEVLSGCTKAGEISVSVRDRVGFYERDRLKVQDELETLARNEAGSLNADIIQPLESPRLGEQRFIAYRCGSGSRQATPGAFEPAAPEPMDSAETFPAGD